MNINILYLLDNMLCVWSKYINVGIKYLVVYVSCWVL